MTAQSGGRGSPKALLDEIRQSVHTMCEAAPGRTATAWEMSERQALIAGLDELMKELTLYRGQLLVAHREDGRWGTAHDRDFADWRARETGAGRGAALGELELAEGLDAMPELADAVERGSLGIEHARTLTRLRSKASPEVREALDNGGLTELLDAGEGLTAPELGKRARTWAAEVDAAAAQKEFDAVRRRRTLTLRTHAGGVKGEFFLDPVAGAELRTALDAIAGRPAADDQRSREMRMADALSVMASRVLQVGADLNGAQVRPHISVLVNEDTWAEILRRRQRVEDTPSGTTPAGDALPDVTPGALEDGTIVPLGELERIMCDCEITRMVMSAPGVPLDVGQTQRTYTKELRRAVTARDKACQWPRCHIRASWCEVHHIRWFSRGGATSLNNGITLCTFHHHRVHDQHIRITALADGFDFRFADGRHLGRTLRQSWGAKRHAGKRAEGAEDGLRLPSAGPPPNADRHRAPPGRTGETAGSGGLRHTESAAAAKRLGAGEKATRHVSGSSDAKATRHVSRGTASPTAGSERLGIRPATYATASPDLFGPDPPF